MGKSKRNVKVYWLQFVIAAIWVGVIEVLLAAHVSYDIKRFIVDILVIMTGILAFEPLGKHILKYVIIGAGASLLIQVLRRVGAWYISSGPGFWKLGGPLIALSVITVLIFIIGLVTQKDKVKV